jgi:hypothetical protein
MSSIFPPPPRASTMLRLLQSSFSPPPLSFSVLRQLPAERTGTDVSAANVDIPLLDSLFDYLFTVKTNLTSTWSQGSIFRTRIISC